MISPPSVRARALVQGAYDTHVHVAPDVIERRIDDIGLAHRFAEVGLAGFVLKSHYVPTAERAQVVRKVVPGVQALGAITLNSAVGGLNPSAVEIAGRQDARVVWMPTVDGSDQDPAPVWADLRASGIEPPAIGVLAPDGTVTSSVRDVLAIVANHGMTLATGHLASEEIVAVADAAFEAGVRCVVVTHPESASQRVPVNAQRRLAARGALLERCFTTPLTGQVSWRRLLDIIRAVGPEHSVLSSDLGRPVDPPVEDGLALMADRLLGDGFGDEEIHTMTVVNTGRVAGAR